MALGASASSGFKRIGTPPSGSWTKSSPPVMPAARFRPTLPSTTTVPPVMYSHAWSPAPSTTASAPELRTANRSPARAGDEQLAARRAVEHRVPGEAADRPRRPRRGDHDPAAAHPLADVVVGLTHQSELDAVRQERAERLPRGAMEVHAGGSGWRGRAEGFADRPTEPRSDGAIDVGDGEIELDDAAVADGRPAPIEHAIAER